jgi:Flp pilus assembly protein CpaB
MAAGLAIAAVVLIVAYLTNYKRHVQNGEHQVPVYVASGPIPAGTPGADLLKSGLIHRATVLQRSLVPGFVNDTKALDSLYVTRPLFENEQVTLAAFGKASARGVQGSLAGTDRAVAISGTPEQLLAGTLRDGDHVDVVASWGIAAAGGSSDSIKVSRVILRDIVVLQAPDTGLKGSGGALPSGTANTQVHAELKLSDTEARELFWMKANGTWSLALRSPLQATNGKDSYDDSVTLLMPALPKGLRQALLHYEANQIQKLEASK